MNNAIPLFDWSVTEGSPNEPFGRLQGRIEAGSHIAKPHLEGRIRTSMIAEIHGRIIVTTSGSIYKLENIDPKYLEWLLEKGYFYDPENPIGIEPDSRKVG